MRSHHYQVGNNKLLLILCKSRQTHGIPLFLIFRTRTRALAANRLDFENRRRAPPYPPIRRRETQKIDRLIRPYWVG